MMIYLLLLLLFFTMQVPIVPYGGATSIEGHTLSPHGGVCIDMSLMKVIIFYFFASVHYPIFEIFKKCITLVLLSCLEYDWNLTSDILETPNCYDMSYQKLILETSAVGWSLVEQLKFLSD